MNAVVTINGDKVTVKCGKVDVQVVGNKVTVSFTNAANATGYDLVLGLKVKKVNGEMRPVEYGKLLKKVYKGNTVTATFTNVPKAHQRKRATANAGLFFCFIYLMLGGQKKRLRHSISATAP